MKTDVYESDPFSGSRGKHLASFVSDYRFERGDELVLSSGGSRLKLRITFIRIELAGDSLRRELHGLKL